MFFEEILNKVSAVKLTQHPFLVKRLSHWHRARKIPSDRCVFQTSSRWPGA